MMRQTLALKPWPPQLESTEDWSGKWGGKTEAGEERKSWRRTRNVDEAVDREMGAGGMKMEEVAQAQQEVKRPREKREENEAKGEEGNYVFLLSLKEARNKKMNKE